MTDLSSSVLDFFQQFIVNSILVDQTVTQRGGEDCFDLQIPLQTNKGNESAID